MKHIVLILLSLIFSLSAVNADGIDFFKGSWEEALQEAKAQDKLIFVDAYTSWCGPCKLMSRKVFPVKEVGDFYNANFVNLKLDMEKDADGVAVRGKYGVRSFPTFLYIDPNEKVVHRAVGAKKPEQFVQLGEMVVRKYDKSADLRLLYEEGNRDPEFLLKYVKALNKSNKSSLKIANEYLNGQTDLTTPINLHFILESAIESDSRIFGLLLQHRDKITALTSKEKVDQHIERACRNTVKKAVQFESEDLLKEAKTNAKNISDAKKIQQFNIESDMAFYKALGNSKKFLKACALFLKTEKGNEPEQYIKLANDIHKNMPKDSKAMSKAESWAGIAAKKSNDPKHYLKHATLLFKNGKLQAALPIAEKVLKLSEKDRALTPLAQKLIEQIKLGLGS